MVVCQRQRPELTPSLAGFQVSMTGRIWVSTEVDVALVTQEEPPHRNDLPFLFPRLG